MNLIFENNGGYVPVRAHDDDAGYDLSCANDIELNAGKVTVVDTCVRILIPHGYVGLVLPRSGLSASGVIVATGVIDAGYTGHIKVAMSVLSGQRAFNKGSRIAQLVVLPLANLSLKDGSVLAHKSQRGCQGYGSSGV
ncbi:MAG: hypothetical protein Q4E81_03530 [Succinatimonas sp.]|nr:hypothetical protein [Succinatimonas sp.]